MVQYMTENEFLKLSDKEISLITKEIDCPKVVVLMPDATRRTGIIYKRMKPSSNDFETVLFNSLSEPFTEIAKMIYDHGLKTLFIPGFTHGNLQRSKRYANALIDTGVRSILTSDFWLNFYKEYKVNVNLYGDFEYVKKLIYKKNYINFTQWCNDVREMTKLLTTPLQ